MLEILADVLEGIPIGYCIANIHIQGFRVVGCGKNGLVLNVNSILHIIVVAAELQTLGPKNNLQYKSGPRNSKLCLARLASGAVLII